MRIKQKKGISLIVLVITIIVMIILAAAIILSLNSSGIIGKANEAKSANNVATEKSAAALKLAEYKLAVEMGEIDPNVIKAGDYVKEELAKDGINITNILITDEGEIITGPAAFFLNNDIPIGTVVTGYTLTEKSYTTDGNERNGYGTYNATDVDSVPQTLTTNTALTWKYVGVDEEGNVLILADMPTSTVTNSTIQLGYDGGYLHGPDILNTVCDALYTTSKGKARSIDMDDVVQILEYTGPMSYYMNDRSEDYGTDAYGYVYFDNAITGEELREYGLSKYSSASWAGAVFSSVLPSQNSQIIGYPRISSTSSDINSLGNLIFSDVSYWLASRYLGVNDNGTYGNDVFTMWHYYCVNLVTSTGVSGRSMQDPDNSSPIDAYTCSIRPIVELDSNVTCTYQNGVVTLK